MKDFWYWVEDYDKKLITTALESGAKVIWLSNPSKVQEVKALGRVVVASKDGADLIEGRDFAYVLIEGKEDEERAAKFPPQVKVIVETTDWTIIPLENLIAQREELYSATTCPCPTSDLKNWFIFSLKPGKLAIWDALLPTSSEPSLWLMSSPL